MIGKYEKTAEYSHFKWWVFEIKQKTFEIFLELYAFFLIYVNKNVEIEFPVLSK